MDKVVHFHIPVDNMKRAREFYTSIFGWKIIPTEMDRDYTLVHTADTDEEGMIKEPGVINGALYVKGTHDEHPSIIINVPSIDEYLKKIEAAGGKVVTPKSPVGDFGLVAEITDTESNLVGLWQDVK